MTEFLHLLFLSDVAEIISVVILIGLFSMQHYGTDKVSWLFAPIVFVWFILIGILGAVNISRYDQSVLKAFNPVYVYRYFKRGKSSWASLGGIMLSITGLNFFTYFIVCLSFVD
jgi:KUP system potassium uptake protein